MQVDNDDKKYRRGRTYSGDYYSATDDLWRQYWAAVEQDNWDFAQGLEEGQNSDFYYDP